ncbi:fimbria/pilus outer membrane usher protein [Paucibacter sp. R3-3]|uniref:Fimbria/pilus outer membrane usher protein n=1 Tax=Roseateles agri TaxID=3098619 RepID=A0ABU5DSD4_9BURK|nr:fimbria/pilus outer membrane usher protein [Paucibacter sp. R3-3]MDY0748651.1 fimbria/pilus outer membrane usher protein [Paucibacter sp. R3-3]
MTWRIRLGTAPDSPCLTALATALLLFLVLPSSAATAVTAQAESRPQWGETLLLALTINGVPQDAMLRAVRLSEGLAVPQSSWDELHLRLPPTGTPRVIDGELHVLLGNDGPLRWRIDEGTQTLEIEAPASAFVAQQLDLAPGVPRVTQPSAWAPFINYDAQWQHDRGSQDAADVLWELGLFGPHGDFSSTGLVRTEARGVRLDTRWQHDMPERLARLTVGDAINQSGAWGRPVRFGGLQWGTDFSLQPGFLSFPLPTLRGEAALPSTLDVYVNNGQRLQSRLQPGAFDLTDLPVVTGQGEIKTVVKDLLGREQVVVTPYYVSPALLKPGLRAGSFEVGMIREDYGIASNHYGRGMLTATERRGLTDRFTGELRAELTRSQQALGFSGWTLWPALGTASASAVASHSSTMGGGWMLAAGLDRQARDWSGSVQVRRMSPGFSQVGQLDGTSPRLVVAMAVGTAWHGQSIGLGYTLQQGGPVESKLAQVNYSSSLGPYGYLGLALFRDFSPGGSGTSLSLSWSYALDARHSAGLSVQRQPDGRGGSSTQLQAQLQRNAGIGSGLGYQLLAETDGHQLAQATWQGEHAVLSGGVARRGDDTEIRAGASGGFALLDGSVFSGRRIEGGIALVDVGGHAGVRVLQDNQVVAHTDARGRAFVTGLRGYQTNRVGIDASDLPMDAELEALEIRLTPAARSAAYIDFPVHRGRSVSLRVVDAAGRPLPPGTLLQTIGQPRSYPVGYDGRAYLAGLDEGLNHAAAAWADGHCQLEFTLPPQGDDDELPDLGSLTCR